MIGYNNKYALLTIERLSPLILLIPAVSYGTGYMTGRKIRTRIHTVISENDRKRIRKENKRSVLTFKENIPIGCYSPSEKEHYNTEIFKYFGK